MFSTSLPYLISSFEELVVIFTRARICETSVKNVTFLYLIKFHVGYAENKLHATVLHKYHSCRFFFFYWAISGSGINHRLNSAALPPTSPSQNPIKVNFEIWPHDWMSMGKAVIYKAISSLLYSWKMCRNIFLRGFSLQVPEKSLSNFREAIW